jgi:regulatory protein
MIKEEALQKLKRYCAYQERCHQEVRTKLLSLKIYGHLLEEIISDLINEDYLNEERFARSYARGKYKLKKWGRNRIEQELKMRRISPYCIKKSMEEIDEVVYIKNLKDIIDKYIREREHQISSDALNRKAFNHAMTKGYEYPLIKKVMDENI